MFTTGLEIEECDKKKATITPFRRELGTWRDNHTEQEVAVILYEKALRMVWQEPGDFDALLST